MKRFIGLLIISVFGNFSIAQQSKKELKLEDIWASRIFASKTVSGINSMNDGEHYNTLEYKEDGTYLQQYAFKTGKLVKTLLTPNDLKYEGKPLEIYQYAFNANETKILISTEPEQIYRHSTKSNYWVIDLKTKTISPIANKEKVRLADFSPTENKVAYVKDNNLFIFDVDVQKETQITFNGKYNHIINGATDWVYEEEFGFDKAFFWSPDGKYIAFYEFDESNVKEFNMPLYQGNLYPKDYRFKYPKAGEENAKVKLHCYNIKTNKTVTIDAGEYEYIPRLKWTETPGIFSFIKMNRWQNKLDLMLADAESGKTKILLSEKSDTYIEITDNLTFLKDRQHFVWSSEQSGFHHFYLYNLDGKLVNQITKGEWDIDNLLGIDEKSKLLYYISAESSAMERDVYAIKLDGTGKKKLSPKKGTNSAYFSKTFKYFINYHSDANTPQTITLHSSDGKLIRVLEDNNELKNTLKNYNLSKKEFFTIKTNYDVTLNAWMIKPHNFDSTKKYPVFMTVYGGPGHNTVNDRWEGQNYLWHQLLAQMGYIIVSVDNRGTGFRGEKFKKCTYMQLGKLETEDQIAAAQYLGTLNFVDKNRIGIQGWSYGGYMSSLCITKGADVFKAAIAVAPVTNWRFYDSIYTERYMRTPQENPNGYDENSPINHVNKLKGKYLLIHGTADDNVHYQNAAEMINALVKANKQFEEFTYPDRNHGIYGGTTRLHLYTLMTNFILRNI
jgi:dipeptidyl-peptidase-4